MAAPTPSTDTRPGGAPPRPDASMDLLNTLRDEALEPEYRTTPRHRHRPGVMVLGLAMAGILFGVAAASTIRTAPAAEQERADLIARIIAAEADLGDLQARSDELSRENAALEREVGGLDPAQISRRETLEVESGSVAVVGPGVRVTLADGQDPDVQGSEVVDADIRMTVNGLWLSGAEAVSVNGYRITGQTAVRNAGAAITVNYRSISPPYVIEAIGDGAVLEDTFPGTEGGQWLAGLTEHYGIAWSLSRERELRLDSATGQDVQYAERRGE